MPVRRHALACPMPPARDWRMSSSPTAGSGQIRSTCADIRTSIHMSMHMFMCMSVHMSRHMSMHMSIPMSTHVYAYVHKHLRLAATVRKS